jgi:general secretion pathway protein L
MAQRILGLDVGARSVKAVLLESAYRGYVVSETRQVPVPDGEEPLRDRQVAAVRGAVEGLAFETALVALPGASAAHHVTLPFTDARRIEQTVGFEVEAQIPYDLTEVAWDWQPLAARDGKSEIFVSVVKREELAGLLAGLAGAGVDPRVVVPPGPAYAALFGAGALADEPTEVVLEGAEAADGAAVAVVPEVSAPRAEVVLDVGATRASVCVVVAGACEAARTFPASPGAAAAVAREVRATLRAWRARAGPTTPPVKRLLLAGAAAATPGLAEALAGEVDGPVAPVALAGPAAERIAPEEAPALTLALALALRGHQASRAPRLNLRRGDLAYTRDFQHVRGRVARLAAWAGLVLLLAMVSSAVKVFALSRQEGTLNRALCDATQKLVGRCYEDFDTAVSVLRGKGTAAGAIPKNSAVDVFAELAARTPQELPLKLDRIEITRDKLHLQGVTDAAENVDRIVTALRTSRCFGDARSGGARRRSSDGKFEFTIDSDLTCDTGDKPAGRT